MKKLLLVLTYFIIGITAFAQEESRTVVYDVIYMKDGRQLKGEILVFEEADGDITFRDTEGRTYSITRYQYDYFVKDRVFAIEARDTVIINARKINEAEISLGLTANYIILNQRISQNDYFLENTVDYAFLPVNFKISVGRYFNRQHFVGFTADVGLLGDLQTNFNAGLRYLFQYPGYASNIAFYLPIELQYGVLATTLNYANSDTASANGSSGYPAYTDYETTIHNVGLHVGQGVAFILPDKRSIKLELTLVKNFIVRDRILNFSRDQPINSFNQFGLRLGVLFSL